MSILPVARMMECVVALSVTEAACTVTSILGNSVSNSFLMTVRVEGVRPMIIMREIPACAKALQIPRPMPPAVFCLINFTTLNMMEWRGGVWVWVCNGPPPVMKSVFPDTLSSGRSGEM